MYATINPFTNETLKIFPDATDAEVAEALDVAHTAFRAWRETTIAVRCAILKRAATLIRDRRDKLARLSTTEMGRLYGTSLYEVDLAVSILDYYADNAALLLASESLPTAVGEARVMPQPTGIILAIEPWNGPFYQVIRPLAPQLALGNVLILKHAPSVPQCAAAVVDIMREAGAPEGVFTNLYATHAQIETIIADPRVCGVTLTGSERAGATVAALAGRALKKTVLELGGADAMIVLDDADLGYAIACGVAARMAQSGQICIAAKRIIVVDAIYDTFVESYKQAMSGLSPGDPLDPATSLAPLSSQAAADGVAAQIRLAVEHGAEATELGGKIPASGAFVQPTLLLGVTAENPIFRQEIFGPVPIIFRVKDEAEAIALANDSPYGLAGSVYTRDIERGQKVAAQIETGMLWINSPSYTVAELPFGGIKRSGYGHELGKPGLIEFANQKLVVVPHVGRR